MTAKRKKGDSAPTAWEAPDAFAHLFERDTGRAAEVAREVLKLSPDEAARVRERAKAPVRGRAHVKRRK